MHNFLVSAFKSPDSEDTTHVIKADVLSTYGNIIKYNCIWPSVARAVLQTALLLINQVID